MCAWDFGIFQQFTELQSHHQKSAIWCLRRPVVPNFEYAKFHGHTSIFRETKADRIPSGYFRQINRGLCPLQFSKVSGKINDVCHIISFVQKQSSWFNWKNSSFWPTFSIVYLHLTSNIGSRNSVKTMSTPNWLLSSTFTEIMVVHIVSLWKDSVLTLNEATSCTGNQQIVKT